ncbi:MAG: NmrA family transcriptional regulator [Deltaproteobacteria bacterium HGW-Deltaproteobacteria-14]|jgi:uncharacterized protein YbjT (DUF2867 family)|nr:MAG: NmrA family transcriptional regulator [Deltaproteobacteria bacterium HGW-Deltaproteobacteria-14]
MTTTTSSDRPTTLVLGATGKTGRRVAARLAERGWPVRHGSRSATPAFDWDSPATWPAALAGVDQLYVSYQPDLAIPAALPAITRLTRHARELGVRRIVLLSGRGEPGAQACEEVVLDCGIPATVVRASWFAQNFSEGHFLEPILAGTFPFPVDTVGEPFVDVDDIADVAAAALTTEDDRHVGQLYEVTGPRLLTFPEAVGEIAAAAGRPIAFVPVSPEAYRQELLDADVPPPFADFLVQLVTTVLDGRNAQVSDGVQRALGRPARAFADFARGGADVWAAG